MKKKQKMKKVKNRENDKCTCKHERIYHQGISGACYYPKCKCVRFVIKAKKENKCSFV